MTDPHLDFLGKPINPHYYREGVRRFGLPKEFGEHLRKTYPDCEAVLFTGDIAEAPSLRDCIRSFLQGWQKPLYFVLGNHDYYGGSFAGVRRQIEQWKIKATWLRQSGVIELAPDLALCGHDGWYDGRAGADPIQPFIIMTDFTEVKDLKYMTDFDRKMFLRTLAGQWAAEAEVFLREACAKYKNVVFATHVPPFPDATWHHGEPSNNAWLPWMCSVTMGDMLIDVAYAYPETRILVLCGHTHSPGSVWAAPNLQVLTGESEYWYPQVSGVLDLPASMGFAPVPER